MQQSWRNDHDKLTFIACLPISSDAEKQGEAGDGVLKVGEHDVPDRMVGDVNLFLSQADEDEQGVIGEYVRSSYSLPVSDQQGAHLCSRLELMIAPTTYRRQGLGRATILAFLHYIQKHLPEILAEYAAKESLPKARLLQLKVKIGSKNEKSIKLFESIGFIKVAEGPNYFGELELVFEGFLGEGKIGGLMERWGIEGYRECVYVKGDDR